MKLPTQCQDPLCKKDRRFYCDSHKVVICKECEYQMHAECETIALQEVEEVKDYLKFVGDLLRVYNKKAFSSSAEFYIPQATRKLALFMEEYQVLADKVNLAFENDAFRESHHLESELKEFQIRLKKDELLRDINHISNITEISHLRNTLSSEVPPRARMMEKNREILDKYKSKVDADALKDKTKFERNCHQRIEEAFKDQMEMLKTSLVEKDQAILEVQSSHDQLEEGKRLSEREAEEAVGKVKEMEKRAEEIGKEMRELKENVKRLDEEVKKETSLKMQVEENFKKMKEEIEGFDQDIIFKLSTEEGRATRDVLSEIKLPHLKKLRIDSIDKTDLALKEFLSRSCSPSLKYFNFNVLHYVSEDGSKAIDISYYFESMKKVLESTTKEIYFGYLIVSPDSLCDIIKASSQCERLVLCQSKINTSDDLDFSIDLPYKTKYLSFAWCGDEDWCNMEWDKYPERFEKIVKAIKESGLKNSLETLNIKLCKISIDQVSGLLKDHGLSHINVVDEKIAALKD